MYTKYLGAAVFLYVLVLNVQGRPQQDVLTATTEPTTWDKIKKGVEHGWNVVYDESHCALHKVKELVQHHEHDNGSDPCTNKPYQQNATTTTVTTEKTISLIAREVIPPTSQPL